MKAGVEILHPYRGAYDSLECTGVAFTCEYDHEIRDMIGTETNTGKKNR